MQSKTDVSINILRTANESPILCLEFASPSCELFQTIGNYFESLYFRVKLQQKVSGIKSFNHVTVYTNSNYDLDDIRISLEELLAKNGITKIAWK